MAPPQNVSHLTFKFWKVCPVPSLGFLFCTYGYCFAHVFLDWSANTVLEGAMGDGIDGDHLAQDAPSAYHASRRPCQQKSLPDFLIFYWSKRSPGEDNPLMLLKSPVLCYQTRLFNNIRSCCGHPARFCLLPDLNVYSSETAQCV